MSEPFAGDTRPKLPPASDPELIATLQLASVEQVVGDILFEEIQSCGAAWRDLAQKKKDALDEDNLRDVFQQIAANEGVDAMVNRQDRRAEASVLRTMSGDVKEMILMAQHNITYQAYGDEESGQYREDAKKDFEREQQLYALGENDGQSLASRYMTKVYVEIGESFEVAVTAENDLIQKLVHWIGSHPNRFGELVEWMHGPDADPHGENRPLFELLARFEFDPKLQFIDIIGEHWKNQPRVLQGNATSHAVDTAIPPTKSEHSDTEQTPELNLELTDADASWIRFIPKLLGQLGVEADNDRIKSALKDIAFDDLPESLREAITNTHTSQLDTLRKAYLEALEPFKKPSRFLAFDMPKRQEAAQQTGGKKKRHNRERGGRTTAGGRALAQVVEIEPVAAINAIHGVTKTLKGYVLTELPQAPQVEASESAEAEPTAEASLRDTLLNSVIAQKFLKRYQNDTRLPQDIEHMFESILLNPRGNGVTKLINETITLGEEGSNARKAYTIWHLNPNKRSGLSLGDVGRKTRIYFAVIPGDNGEELVLLDVSNKNVTEEYRSGDWKW